MEVIPAELALGSCGTDVEAEGCDTRLAEEGSCPEFAAALAVAAAPAAAAAPAEPAALLPEASTLPTSLQSQAFTTFTAWCRLFLMTSLLGAKRSV